MTTEAPPCAHHDRIEMPHGPISIGRLKKACAIPDCRKPRRVRAWCKMHWTRWRRHGSPYITKHLPEIADRFWSKVNRTGSCWLWIGAVHSGGYGVFGIGDGTKTTYAHRWAYETLVGPIPDGLEVDHLCRTRNCVRVDHLELVTHKENILRGVGGPAINAAKTHCLYGHAFRFPNVYIDERGWRHCRTCWRETKRLAVTTG